MGHRSTVKHGGLNHRRNRGLGRGSEAHLRNTLVRDGRDIIIAAASDAFSPAVGLSRAIGDALDPSRVPGKVRTLADMSEAERAKMLKLYARESKP